MNLVKKSLVRRGITDRIKASEKIGTLVKVLLLLALDLLAGP